MSKGLIIVESPAKAKTIGKFLDFKYDVKASMGHVRDLPKRSMGVDLEHEFKPKYVVDRTKKKIIDDLKKSAEEADAIYLASDHDREGEAIAWHILEVLKGEAADKPVYRIVFNEITKTAIREAMEHPGEIDKDKVDAQQARRILDRIVGYKISPVLWRVITTKLSAGRVQSVALRLICEREAEIKAFVPEEYWTLDAIFSKDDLTPFKATLTHWDGKKQKMIKAEDAQKMFDALDKKPGTIQKIDRTEKKINPQPAYITSTLQQDASRILGFSGKKTMMVAQQLYEGIDIGGDTVGLISYMRTDSLRIADIAIDACRDLIKDRYGKESLHKSVRKFENKNKAQDAHEAIRPTDPFRTPEQLSKSLEKDQLKLYTLIWQRFVATQMTPIRIDAVNMEIGVDKGVFSASGGTIRHKGFLEAFPHTRVILGENIDAGYQENSAVGMDEFTKNQHFTKPPSRFSEASLIKELESKGIGRPSTYAVITNTILERKYVKIDTKKFVPTTLGVTVNDFLVKHFDELFNVQFTADMEESLDKVEYGEMPWNSILDDYYKSIADKLETIDYKQSKKEAQEETDIKCEKCGHNMIVRWAKSGQFLGCSNYPECKNIKNFKRDEDGTIHVEEPEHIDEKCPQCGSDLTIKNGRFGKFIACTNYPKCKFTKPFSLGIKCPKCGDGDVVERKDKRGKSFFGCSKYPDCDYISRYKPVNKKCSECGNEYLEEHFGRDGEKWLQCPKCKAKTGNASG